MNKQGTMAMAVKLTGASLLLALAASAQAQPIYRIVGPDGKVTFSDKPPPASAKDKAAPATVGGPAAAAANGALPYELRQVATKYPVTLYTGENCGPCGGARAMLGARGIPYTERTVTSNEDIQALQRLSGDNTLPLLTIGGQQLKGYSDAEWTQFLDAAGYPKTSGLPSGYRNGAASPLVAVSTRPTETAAAAAPAAPTRARPAAPAQQAPAPAVNASNPAGITF